MDIDGLFPEQGRKGYDVDIVEIRRQLGEGICLIGFNKEQDLIEGNRDALASEIQRQMEGAGQKGAIIMGTTIETAEAPVAHVEWYVETARQLGRYSGWGAGHRSQQALASRAARSSASGDWR